MHVSRFRGFVAALAALGMACAGESAGIDPPGFSGGTTPRLFFPTGIALAPDGQSIYVANSNFDRAFTSGTVLQIAMSAFDGTGAVDVAPHVRSQGKIGTFAVQAGVNPDGNALFIPTGDPAALVRVLLAPAGGTFVCAEGNCGLNAVDLETQKMDRPSSLTFAPPGRVIVGHTSPAQEDEDASAPARVAVIPEVLASQDAQPFSNGAYTVQVGPGMSGVLFDATQGRVLLSGCFERQRGGSVQPCGGNQDSAFFGLNPLRSFALAGGAGANVQTNVLGPNVGGGDSTALALATSGTALYVLSGAPNALLVTALPEPGRPLGLVASSIGLLPAVPRGIAVLPRPSGDIVAVTSLEDNTVILVDPASGQVITQLRLVGGGPNAIAVQDTPAGWRLFISLFNGCGVAAVDVPEADPIGMRLVSIAGRCP